MSRLTVPDPGVYPPQPCPCRRRRKHDTDHGERPDATTDVTTHDPGEEDRDGGGQSGDAREHIPTLNALCRPSEIPEDPVRVDNGRRHDERREQPQAEKEGASTGDDDRDHQGNDESESGEIRDELRQGELGATAPPPERPVESHDGVADEEPEVIALRGIADRFTPPENARLDPPENDQVACPPPPPDHERHEHRGHHKCRLAQEPGCQPCGADCDQRDDGDEHERQPFGQEGNPEGRTRPNEVPDRTFPIAEPSDRKIRRRRTRDDEEVVVVHETAAVGEVRHEENGSPTDEARDSGGSDPAGYAHDKRNGTREHECGHRPHDHLRLVPAKLFATGCPYNGRNRSVVQRRVLNHLVAGLPFPVIPL